MPFDCHLDFTLRNAHEADLPAIHQLLQQVGLAQPPQSADLRFWLAERDGLVLGCVAALDLGSNWLLRSLAVAPAAGGQGIGHALLRQLWLAASDARVAKLYLVTTNQQPFFARLGFVEADRARLPEAVANCSQLTGECPSSSTVMALKLAPGVWLRRATAADMGAVVAIYNKAVAETTACYDYDPRPLEVQQQLFADKQQAGHPLLVAESPERTILGFATVGLFRGRPGWRFTCEHSVYVRPTEQGRGIGSRLLAAIIAHASAAGFHGMVGVVDNANQGSLALHRRHGFEVIGVMAEGGYKFERWLDVAFVHRLLCKQVPTAGCDPAHK